jgi:23S rRNA (uracil1939-C5)-methyltransferase
MDITDLAYRGAGVGRIEGKTCFVPFTAPGDRVEVLITRDKKRYSFGEVRRIIEPSPDRVEPRCPVFTVCGGCDWQHLPYDRQVRAKGEILESTLMRIGGIKDEMPEVSLFPSPSPWNYRTAVQVKIDLAEGAGFFRKGSNRIVPVGYCPISHPAVNRRLEELNRGLKEPRPVGHTEATEQPAEVETPGGSTDRPGTEESLAEVELFVDEGGVLHEKHHPPGKRAFPFHQVNREVNEIVLRRLAEWASGSLNRNDSVADLFCGNGNLSLPLAERVGRIDGWDTSEEALAEGRGKVREKYGNRPAGDRAAVVFHREEASKVLGRIAGKKSDYTLVIIDPPRGGLKASEKELSSLEVPWVYYLSCDPPSLARDLKPLLLGGYRPTRIDLYDMFPQTYHIEAGVILEKSPRSG